MERSLLAVVNTVALSPGLAIPIRIPTSPALVAEATLLMVSMASAMMADLGMSKRA